MKLQISELVNANVKNMYLHPKEAMDELVKSESEIVTSEDIEVPFKIPIAHKRRLSKAEHKKLRK